MRQKFLQFWRGLQPSVPARAGKLVADRRGVTALVFAVTAAVLLGVAGLATEVGAWYLIRLQTTNAADAAAIAGAQAYAITLDSGAATDSAMTVLSLNGISASGGSTSPATGAGTTPPGPAAVMTGRTVAVAANSPPLSGNYAGDPAATEVIVRIGLPPIFASLFTSQTPALASRSVGRLQTIGSACVLTTAGPLTIMQSQQGLADGYCYYASNSTRSDAVGFASSAWIQTYGITTPGDCTNCPVVANGSQSPVTGGTDSTGQNLLLRPNASYQPPTTWLPYAAIDPAVAALLPSPSMQIICPTGLAYVPNNTPLDPVTHCPTTSGARAIVTSTANLVPSVGDPGNPNGATCTPTAGRYCGYYNMTLVICGNLGVSPCPAGSGATVTLPPTATLLTAAYGGSGGNSTFLFVNASLTVQSGATVQCMVNWQVAYFNGNLPCAPGPQNADGYSTPPGAYGVTIVFAGSQVGTLTISSGASANLAAPAVNSFSATLNGMLFYRAGQSSGESYAAPGVNISDTSSNVLLNGGMYFPVSYVFYTANTNPTPQYTPTCSFLVAGNATLGFFNPNDSQANPSQFSPASCALNYGTPMPNVQAAQLVE